MSALKKSGGAKDVKEKEKEGEEDDDGDDDDDDDEAAVAVAGDIKVLCDGKMMRLTGGLLKIYV
jgi:hypothetical protein